jgi:carboxypeptidase Taq
MHDRWIELDRRARELNDLDKVLGLLGWDEETYAPDRARPGRGRQNATLEAIRHQRLVEPALGELVHTFADDTDELRRMLARRLGRRRARALAVSERLVRAFAEARSAALASWQEAKRASRFELFAPHLERLIELAKERADALCTSGATPHAVLRYDALLDENEPDMTAGRLVPLFAELRVGLVALLTRLRTAPRTLDASALRRPMSLPAQEALTLQIIGALGFDLTRGRQDRSTHPFSQTCGEDDVRLTTRYVATDPVPALYASIHEAGHGMYEQGFDRAHVGTELANAPSMGLHESQSRLWENQVARSRPFCAFLLPRLQQAAPGTFDDVDVDALHRAINVVRPDLIRVEADEVTYNLHVMLRFELERALFAGDLSVADVPAAWNARMVSDLGVAPPDDARGCLQDIHWATGAFGYFPSYTLGNCWSAQLMSAFERAHPDASAQLSRGEFGVLLEWLRTHVHRRGDLESAEATVLRATGESLSPKPLLAHLESRFGALYGLDAG